MTKDFILNHISTYKDTKEVDWAYNEAKKSFWNFFPQATQKEYDEFQRELMDILNY